MNQRQEVIELDDKYVDVTHFNYDTNKAEVVIPHLSLWLVAKSMSVKQFASMLSDWINSYSVDYNAGEEIGKLFRFQHRTLQGTLYRLVLGILVGLSQQEYTDPRNEVAVRNSKKIAQMLDDGTVERGYMI